MSVKQITRVFADTTITSNEKLVMLALADYAGDEGVAFPLVSTLEKKCSLPKRTILNNIKKLQEKGVLLRKLRARKSGGRSSSKYLLYPLENWTVLDEETRQYFSSEYSQSADLAPMTQSADLAPNPQSQSADLAPCYIEEPSPSINRHSPPITPPNKNDDYFNDFWEVFADKRGKDGALRVWKRLKLDNIAQDVINGAAAYARTRGGDKKYWKQAQGWLNDGRWKDEYQPTHEWDTDENTPF